MLIHFDQKKKWLNSLKTVRATSLYLTGEKGMMPLKELKVMAVMAA
jgi:hypothetical protein